MKQHQSVFPVVRMSRTLQVSVSGYYAYLRRSQSKRRRDNEALLMLIKLIFKQYKQRYGSPRIYAELKAQGHGCSLNRVARLMRENNLRAKARRKFKATTNSKHSLPIAKDLLEQDFSAPAANRVWVADITYIWTQEGWLYLAAILDLYSRRIVGMAMDARIDRHLVILAFQQAITRREINSGLIHHSDRGSQYASYDFQAELKRHGVLCSMSGKGNCFDNAAMESFFHTLKMELIYWENYQTRQEAIANIFEYVEVFYNNQRRHSTLNYLSPREFEVLNGVSIRGVH
jgi:putative transposase